MATLLNLLGDRQVWAIALKTVLVLLVAPATVAAKQALSPAEPARWTIPQANWSFRAASRAAVTTHRADRGEAATPPKRPRRRRAVSQTDSAGRTEMSWRPAARRAVPGAKTQAAGITRPRVAPFAPPPREPAPDERDEGESGGKSGDRSARGDDRGRGDDDATPALPEEPPASDEPPVPEVPVVDPGEPGG